MGRPESIRRIRLWASTTSYSELKALPHPELFYIRVNLFELGGTHNDLLKYKQLMALASAPFTNAEQTNKLLKAYKDMLLPEFSKDKYEGPEMSALMNELENTIVVIDKDSIKNAGK